MKRPEPISEAMLLATAKIVGVQSAAQHALDDAKERRKQGECVSFWRVGHTILVVTDPALSPEAPENDGGCTLPGITQEFTFRNPAPREKRR